MNQLVVPAHLRRPRAAEVTEESARDNHNRSASAIEGQAEALRENTLAMVKVIKDGIDAGAQAMTQARASAELRVEETKAQLHAAAVAHGTAVDDYVELCRKQAEAFRADGERLLGVIKRADDIREAKTQAILTAGEEAESPAPQEGPPVANDQANAEVAAA